MLREKLAKAEVLERYLKAKNVKLRGIVLALREQKKAIKRRGTFYYRKGYRWFHEAIKLTKRVNSLKREIHQLRERTNERSQLDLLAEIANRA